MIFYSTNNKSTIVTLRDAVLAGMAPDGGLLMPDSIPAMPVDFIEKTGSMSFQEVAFKVARSWLSDDLPIDAIHEIIDTAFDFDVPVIQLDEHTAVLELFHGPTLAFKDFAARFMARLLSCFTADSEKELNILVATSGDTGSAVAQGFLDVPGIRVFILYPGGKISAIQEKQLTTMGHNITALEIAGTFDDCQKLVKLAFSDRDIKNRIRITSANSINIARLIPQSFYYFYAYGKVRKKGLPVVFSVPSGNFGNLTAGLIAQRMGLPIARFIAATNINDSVPRYLNSGTYDPLPMRKTISNAMDVGNPSNFTRMLDLYDSSAEIMKKDIWGIDFSDGQTRAGIQDAYTRYTYIMDPHGAIGYLGLQTYQANYDNEIHGVFLETAHPAKFLDVVQPLIDKPIIIPDRLKACLEKEKQSIPLNNNFDEFKQFLLEKT